MEVRNPAQGRRRQTDRVTPTPSRRRLARIDTMIESGPKRDIWAFRRSVACSYGIQRNRNVDIGPSRLRIPLDERLLQGVGYFEQFGGPCQLVLTEEYLAWRSQWMPPFLAQYYSVIPLAYIRVVTFSQKYELFGSCVGVEFVPDLPNAQMKVTLGNLGS